MGYQPYSNTRSMWYKWFAWYPVKVHSKTYWFKRIYRRDIVYSNPFGGMMYDAGKAKNNRRYRFYEYGTIFDIIKTNHE